MVLRLSTFPTDVRNTVLAGFSTASSAVVTAADSVLSALGKLQAQLTLSWNAGAVTSLDPSLHLSAGTLAVDGTEISALPNVLQMRVRAANAAPIPAHTYANGTAGVGATITASADGALVLDGVTVVAGDAVLIGGDQSSLPENGVYIVTQPGDAGTPFVLTRHWASNKPGEFSAQTVVTSWDGNTFYNAIYSAVGEPVVLGTDAIQYNFFGWQNNAGGVFALDQTLHVSQPSDSDPVGGTLSVVQPGASLPGTISGAFAIDVSNPNIRDYEFTVGGNITLSVTGVGANVIRLNLVISHGGAFTVNWWAGIEWAAGAPPTLSASGTDIVQFYHPDISSGWFGFVLGGPQAGTATPLIDGTAAVGTSLLYARQDHVHPTDTSRYAASNPAGYQTAAQIAATLAAPGPIGGTTPGAGTFSELSSTGGFFRRRVNLGASSIIDLNAGSYFAKTIAGATSLSVINTPAAGTAASFTLELTNGGAFPTNWWSGLKWPGGTPPTLSTGGGIDVFQFYQTDPANTVYDGATWSSGTSLPVSTNWVGLVAGVSSGTAVLLAIANNGTTAMGNVGAAWTQGALPASTTNWIGVAFGNGVFFALALTNGSTGSSSGAVSSDGITWTSVALPSAGGNYNSVTFVNGLFIACAGGSVVTSSNGSTWTVINAGSGAALYAAAYGNGVFLATGAGTGGATSPDGITWTPRPLPTAGPGSHWSALAFGNGVFVAASNPSGRITTSPDGITWSTFVTVSGSGSFLSSVFVPPPSGSFGVFILVGSSANCFVATDGVNWVPHPMPASQSWNVITVGTAGGPVAVGGISTVTGYTVSTSVIGGWRGFVRGLAMA